MLSAESWVAISFVCFFALFGRKLYTMLVELSKQYIIEIENKITEAEQLREEAAGLLKKAYEKKSNIVSELENYKRESEARVNCLKQEATEHLAQIERQMSCALENDIQATLSKKSQQIIEQLSQEFSAALEEKIKIERPKIKINISDLDKLKSN